MKINWYYFASLFTVILLMVVTDQIFDAMKVAKVISDDNIVIKVTGWILMLLLVFTGLLASKYATQNNTTDTESQSSVSTQLVTSMVLMLLVFIVLLIVINILDIGNWIVSKTILG